MDILKEVDGLLKEDFFSNKIEDFEEKNDIDLKEFNTDIYNSIMSLSKVFFSQESEIEYSDKNKEEFRNLVHDIVDMNIDNLNL